METRRLGSQGLKVSALGFGCMSTASMYGRRDDSEALATIESAIDLGASFLDTADVYGPHTSEKLVGQVLQRRRQEVVVATKFGLIRSASSPALTVCGRPEYARSACEASLQRLGVECIDLYYLHRVDRDVPIEETVGAMAELVRAGKVRYLGLSEASPATLRRAHAVHPISALQSEYSLWSRDPEDEILPTIRELGIGFVAYSPLGRGFLTGQVRRFEDLEEGDVRRYSPRFQGENFARNLELVERIRSLATAKGCTPAQLALAWLLAQGADIVPIPGTGRRSAVAENVGAAGVHLTAGDLAQIEAVTPRGAVAGPRYPPAMMQYVNG